MAGSDGSVKDMFDLFYQGPRLGVLKALYRSPEGTYVPLEKIRLAERVFGCEWPAWTAEQVKSAAQWLVELGWSLRDLGEGDSYQLTYSARKILDEFSAHIRLEFMHIAELQSVSERAR
jgi:hypothetical protein